MRHLTPLLVLVLAGCGPAASTSGAAGEPVPPAVSAAPTLLPDGTVPWVDEPAGLREYDVQVPVPPSPPAGARPCRAEQLAATLPAWNRQGDGGEPGVRRPPPGLFGSVAVTLRGGTPCTLQGKAGLRLLVDGAEAPVQYSDAVTAEAEQRTTTLTAERGAELRVDWSPPYCGPAGAQQLVITLPDGGGELRADVGEAATPSCTSGGETGTELRTYVSGSVFEPARVATPLDSPLRVLRATAEQVPATAPAGGTVDYVVRLTNPTSSDVPLDPCPGYLQERFVLSTGDAPGFNDAQVYRLNCRPVAAVPAGSSVAFRVRAAVPTEPPGPSYVLTWRLLAPGLPGEDALRFGVTLPVTP